MKNFDLESMGVHEMNALEMKETDGGLPLILAAIALIALVGTTSCHFEANFQIGGSHNTMQSSDSIQNGWSADSTRVDLNLTPPISR